MNTTTATQKENVTIAFAHFTAAWQGLQTAWSEMNPELFKENYPFTKSFDDMLIDVNKWEETSIGELNKIDEPIQYEGYEIFSMATDLKNIINATNMSAEELQDSPDSITHLYVNVENEYWIALHSSGKYSSEAINESFYSDNFYEVEKGVEEILGITPPVPAPTVNLIINQTWTEENDTANAIMFDFRISHFLAEGNKYRVSVDKDIKETVKLLLKTNGIECREDNYETKNTFLNFELKADIFVSPCHHIELRVRS